MDVLVLISFRQCFIVPIALLVSHFQGGIVGREKEGKGRREGGREGGKERVGRRKESLPPTNKDFISK